MQPKILKTVSVVSFLGLLSIQTTVFAEDAFDDGLATLQPGYYATLSYTYATIQNARMRGYTLVYVPPGNDPGSQIVPSYEDKYGSGNGASLRFGKMFSKHWGVEGNFNYIYAEHSTDYTGEAMAGSDYTPVQAHLVQNTQTAYTELLGVYALSLNYNLNLYAKLGAGFEYERIKYVTTGLSPEAQGPYRNLHNTTLDYQRDVGAAAGAELRYVMTDNWNLSLEMNDLAAKQNILAGSVGLTYSFSAF